MKAHLWLAGALLLGAATGCGGDDQPEVSPSAVPTPTGPSVTIPGTPTAGTPTAVPSMQLVPGGPWYPIPVAQCMQKVWDDRVDEWNRLVEKRDASGARDVVVDGRTYETSAEYSKSKGWPATFEATMKAPATIKACANAR